MIFWISLLIITAIICTIGFYPLLKKSIHSSSNQRDELNKAFYFARLQEVKNETDSGVIDNPEQTQLELQQSLLEDIPEQSAYTVSTTKSFGKVWFLTLVVLVLGVSVGIYFKVGSWFTNTMLDSSHQKLDYFYERMKNEQKEPLSEQELNQFAMALRVELQKNPNDDKSWFVLGQVAMATNNGQLALDSFAKANKLQPDNTQYKLSYAQILMFSEDASDNATGEQLLKEVIRVDHTNVDALSLLAFRAFEQEDYKMAAMTWGMMLRLMPKEDPRIPTIERSIESARAMIKGETQTPAQEIQKEGKK